MPDDRRQESELNRFWNELADADAEPAVGELDAAQAETLRRIHAMTRTPPPAGARASVDGAMRLHIAARQNGRGPSRDDRYRSTCLPPVGKRTTGVAPATPCRAARANRVALAPPLRNGAARPVTIGLGYLVFGPNRPNPERPADQPAVVAPATASPSATPDGTLATISLPSEELPSEVIGGFNYYSVAPGSVGTWDWTCCTGLRVDYILSGTLTIRGAGPMQVLRGNGAGSWEDVGREPRSSWTRETRSRPAWKTPSNRSTPGPSRSIYWTGAVHGNPDRRSRPIRRVGR